MTCLTCRYLPNLRYIARLCEVERAVILDLAPLANRNRNSFVSRNRICERTGRTIWLSIPVHRKGAISTQDVNVDESSHNWIEKHMKSIAHAYPNHTNVAGNFLDRLREVLIQNRDKLIDINLHSLNLILETLSLRNIDFIRQSTLLSKHTKHHRLEVAEALSATTYISGEVEWGLMEKFNEIERLKERGIKVLKTPSLDPLVFNVLQARELSCIHSICTLGPKKTRTLIDQMVQSLKSRLEE